MPFGVDRFPNRGVFNVMCGRGLQSPMPFGVDRFPNLDTADIRSALNGSPMPFGVDRFPNRSGR